VWLHGQRIKLLRSELDPAKVRVLDSAYPDGAAAGHAAGTGGAPGQEDVGPKA
jgi:hypothetical protein